MRSIRLLLGVSLVAAAALACSDLAPEPVQEADLLAAAAPGGNGKGKPGVRFTITGTVALASGVEIPTCPGEMMRSIRDFVPTATALTLVGDNGTPIVEIGTVRKKGTFDIKGLGTDSYTMGFESPVVLGSMQLVFEATVTPGTIDVTTGGSASYEITSATCEIVNPEPADTIWVATDGSDGTGDGSPSNPFLSITKALIVAQDGNLVLVRPGLYHGMQELNGTFDQGVTVRSEIPYAAQLTNNANRAVGVYVAPDQEIYGITMEGFDISHSGPGSNLVFHMDGDNRGAVRNITLRNNIIHDSYENDVLKMNGAATDILIEGNMFYNQSRFDEHIDVNGVQRVTVQDNIFFNDFAGSGRPPEPEAGSFIVIKDSNSIEVFSGSRDIVVRRNIFLNYQGDRSFSFVLVGEDGHPIHEAVGVLVENNLMLGNSMETLRAPMGVKGAKDVTFRNNTVSGDLPSLAYGMRVRTEGSSPPNENINFYNNIWSDPTGTMGASPDYGLDNDFSDSPPALTLSFELGSNLYWNGGAAIPQDPNELINFTDDLTGVVGDPFLTDPANVIVPRWMPDTGEFADGSLTIREAFVHLVTQYGMPGTGSAAFGSADASKSPIDDILGRLRGSGGVDIGAVQR